MPYNQKSRRKPAIGTVRGNKYAGPCLYCGETVQPFEGCITYRRDGWRLTHRPMEWYGSPVSGGYINGCPGEADKINYQLANRDA